MLPDSRISQFRQAVGLTPSVPPMQEPSMWDKIGDYASNAVAGLVAPFMPNVVGGTVSTQAGRTVGQTAVPGVAQQAAVQAPGSASMSGLDNAFGPAQMGSSAAVAPIALLGMGATTGIEYGYHGFNTGLAGTQMVGSLAIDSALGVNQKNFTNPAFRDGVSFSDVTDTYKKVWDGEVTFGQSQALLFGRSALNTANLITGGDAQKRIDEYILQNTAEALNDPTNTRGLYSWASGLYSEFDIYDPQQRDSAFNQGLGRIISGSTDAAVQWYVGPDVLAMKLAGKAGRTLFMQSVDDFADVTKMRANLEAHAKWREQELTGVPIEGAKRTAIGRLADSFISMDELKIAKHAIGRNSTDSAMVGRALGKAQTYEEVSDALLAMSGDLTAAQKMLNRDPILADRLLQQRDDLLDATETFNYWNKETREGVNNWAAAGYNPAVQTQRIERLQSVFDATRAENKSLDAALNALDRQIGMPNAVTIRSINVSKLSFGPNSVDRLSRQADKAVNRATGEIFGDVPPGASWVSESFSSPDRIGRTVRLWKSGMDYLKTDHIRGFMDLTNTDDVLNELEASMQTLPMFRRLAKQGVDALLPGSDMTVGQFRRMILDEVINASDATARMGVVQKYDSAVTKALQSYYDVDAEYARTLVGRYKEKSQEAADQILARGWIEDSGDLHVIPELQSMLAQKMPTIDFRFLENVFRVEKGSGLQKYAGKRGLQPNRALQAFDAFWRPLVLMRLGYTMRNVTEGNLRDLAAYGTLSPFNARSLSRSAMAPEDSWFYSWAASAGHKFDVAKSLRYGSLKKARANVDGQQAIIRRVSREHDEAIKSADAVQQRILERQKVIEGRVRNGLTAQMRENLSRQASFSWEQMDDEWRALASDWFLSTVDEVLINPEFIKPLVTISGKRGTYGTGVSTSEDAVASATNPIIQTKGYMAPGVLPNDETWLDLVSPSMRSKLQELVAKGDENLTPDEVDFWNRSIEFASRSMVNRAARNGDVLVRITQSGIYQIVREPSEITRLDLSSGTIGLLAKEDIPNIEHFRANVLGGTVDARIAPVDIPTTDALEAIAGKDALKVASDANDAGNAAPITEMASNVHDIGRSLLGDAWARSHEELLWPSKDPYWALDTEIEIERALKDLTNLVTIANKYPEVGQALAFATWARSSLGGKAAEDFVNWASDNGLIVPASYIKKLDRLEQSSKEKYLGVDESVIAASREINAYAMDAAYIAQAHTDEFGNSYLEADDFVGMHGGHRVAGDEFGDVTDNLTDQNMGHYKGPGAYVSGHEAVGPNYLVTRAVDNAVSSGTGEPVLYVVNLPGGQETIRQRMIYLDEATDDPMIEQEALDLAEGTYRRLFDEDFNYEEFDSFLENTIAGRQSPDPLIPGDIGDQRPKMVNDYMVAIRDYCDWKASKSGSARTTESTKEFWNAWVDEVRSTGAIGVRHDGGRNKMPLVDGRLVDHEVYVFYDKLPVTRMDDLSDKALNLLHLRNQLVDARTKWQTVRDFNSLVSQSRDGFMSVVPKFGDFPQMKPKYIGIIQSYMREHGIGKFVVNDSSLPSGSRVIVNPDMISVGQDVLDAHVPGAVLAQATAQKLNGADPVGRLIPDFMSDAATRNPRIFDGAAYADTAAEDPYVALAREFNGDQAVANGILSGNVKGLTPDQRGQIVRWMSMNDYTHLTPINIRAGKEFLSTSEILTNARVGAAYAALHPSDEVAALVKAASDGDDVIASLRSELMDAQDALAVKKSDLDKQMQIAKDASDAFSRRLGKRRAAGMPTKGGLGTGIETLYTKQGQKIETAGPFNVAEQGALRMVQSSSQDRITADLYGNASFAMHNMRRSASTIKFIPGDKYYWNAMSEQINLYYRNDPIAEMIFQGADDVAIIDMLQKTQRGRSWVKKNSDLEFFRKYIDKDVLDANTLEDMSHQIGRLRQNIEQLVPDPVVREHIGMNEVSADYLRANMGWRSDLKDIQGYDWVNSDATKWRKATAGIMHVLGTLPEDALVRHPFYRSRWREEMIRQANIYEAQGITDFTPDILNAMSRVSNNWALKQTNETLYTIQRLSTPAHALRFVIPFFPAWASSMRFWMMKMPIEKPESIARYALAFDAPESAGWVYDDEGNKVNGQGNMFAKIASKLVGSADNSIVVQISPEYMEKVGFLTGGQSRISVGKGSLDAMLQGNYPFIPSLGPLVSIPVSWVLAQRPDIATTLETGNLTGTGIDNFISKSELSKALYQSVVPFGQLPNEKNLALYTLKQILPSALQRGMTAIQGEQDPSFLAAASELYRTQMTDWELGGKQGKKPEFLDAVGDTKQFYWFRGLLNLTLPFAPSFQSKYQFYIDEYRRIEREAYQPGGGGYLGAQQQFIDLYGPEFIRYTKSLSGSSSGVSSTVGEYEEYSKDPQLMAYLANSASGTDASLLTIATRPYAKAMNDSGYDQAVHAWQMDQVVSGTTNKYLRGGGSGEQLEFDVERERGWNEYNGAMDQLDAILVSRGLSDYDQSGAEDLAATKKDVVNQISALYPRWFEDYNTPGSEKWIQGVWAMDGLLHMGTWWDRHKDEPYAKTVGEFMNVREQFVSILAARAAQGGSANIEAKSNLDLAATYAQVMQQVYDMDPTGAFADVHRRWFRNDPLKPVPMLKEVSSQMAGANGG